MLRKRIEQSWHWEKNIGEFLKQQKDIKKLPFDLQYKSFPNPPKLKIVVVIFVLYLSIFVFFMLKMPSTYILTSVAKLEEEG